MGIMVDQVQIEITHEKRKRKQRKQCAYFWVYTCNLYNI